MGHTNDKKLIHVNVKTLFKLAPENTHRFLEYTIDYCNKNKLKINISEGETVNLLGSECAGSFSARDQVLNVAVGTSFDEWFPVYVHEFCHANQYVENKEWFSRLDIGSDTVFLWSDGDEFGDDVLDAAFADTIMLESDCEARAVKMIEKHGLTSIIDVKEYAQRGNAYVNYYQHFRKTRKWWSSEKTPYLLRNVYTLFPEVVCVGGIKLSEEQTKAFEECTIP